MSREIWRGIALAGMGLAAVGGGLAAYANHEGILVRCDPARADCPDSGIKYNGQRAAEEWGELKSKLGDGERAKAEEPDERKNLPSVSGAELVAIHEKLRAMAAVICQNDVVKPGSSTTTTPSDSVEACLDAPHTYIKNGESMSWLVTPLAILPPPGHMPFDVPESYANATPDQCSSVIAEGRRRIEEILQNKVDAELFRTKDVPIQILLDRNGSTRCDEPPFQTSSVSPSGQVPQ